MRSVLVAVFCCIPMFVSAAVTISEITWMGSAASANHEWIELYNSGEATDVTGWTLTDGMNLNIPLTGVIEGGAYAVLERTSDDSAPGTAFIIYTGALVNTGATLTLKRADGGIEDQVAGGENWQSVGGDNVTKETAQYTTAGWVTGTPTPGDANSGTVRNNEETEDQEEDDTDEETPKTSKSSSPSETVRLILTDAMLSLKVDAQKKGYVNQPIEFEVLPSGVGKTITNSLSYQWNFGDGGVTFGSNPTHTFAYPGTYIVTVYGSYKRQEQLARHEITILPVAISVTKNIYGDVQINNDSPYEIDVSGYLVKGEKSWRFPDYSIILPNQTVTLKRGKVGGGFIRVFDGEGSVVAVSKVNESRESSVVPSLSDVYASSPTISFDTPDLPLVLTPSAFSLPTPSPQVAGTSTSVASEVITPKIFEKSTSSSSKIPDNAWPYLGLIIVILLGLIGTATKITRNQSE